MSSSDLKFNVINFDKEVLSEISLPSFLFETNFDSNFFSDFYTKIRKKNYKIRGVRKERISGGGRKPYKQKGTGNARCGSIRAGGRRGGLTFGSINPFRAKVSATKKEIFYGKIMLISHKYKSECFFILNDASFDFHSTKKAVEVFSKFTGKSSLIIHEDNISANTFLAVRNLSNIKYVNYSMLTINDILSFDNVFLTVKALDKFRGSVFI